MSIPIYLISTQESSKNKLTYACGRHIFRRIPRSFFILSLYWLFFSAAIEYWKMFLLHTVDIIQIIIQIILNKLGVECYMPTIIICCVRYDLIKASINALIIRLSSNYWIKQFQRPHTQLPLALLSSQSLRQTNGEFLPQIVSLSFPGTVVTPNNDRS